MQAVSDAHGGCDGRQRGSQGILAHADFMLPRGLVAVGKGLLSLIVPSAIVLHRVSADIDLRIHRVRCVSFDRCF